jgi:hypothetical protein
MAKQGNFPIGLISLTIAPTLLVSLPPRQMLLGYVIAHHVMVSYGAHRGLLLCWTKFAKCHPCLRSDELLEGGHKDKTGEGHSSCCIKWDTMLASYQVIDVRLYACICLLGRGIWVQ